MATTRGSDDGIGSTARGRLCVDARKSLARAAGPICAGSVYPSGADDWWVEVELARLFACAQLGCVIATETHRRGSQISIRLHRGFGETGPPPPARQVPAGANVLFHDLDVVQRAEVAVVYLRRDLIAHFDFVVDVRLVG